MQTLNNWNQKAEGLAGTCLCRRQNVAAFQRRRNCACLDRGRDNKFALRELALKRGKQSEICKLSQCFPSFSGLHLPSTQVQTGRNTACRCGLRGRRQVRDETAGDTGASKENAGQQPRFRETLKQISRLLFVRRIHFRAVFLDEKTAQSVWRRCTPARNLLGVDTKNWVRPRMPHDSWKAKRVASPHRNAQFREAITL